MDDVLVTSGDCKGITPNVLKRSAKKSPQKEEVGHNCVGHVGVAYIGDCIHKTPASEKPCLNNPFYFNCGLGDQWHERYPCDRIKNKNRRRLKITTGDAEANNSLAILQENGYQPQQVLSKGTSSSTILSSSSSHHRDIVLKFLLPEKHKPSTKNTGFGFMKKIRGPCGKDCENKVFESLPDEVLLQQPLKHKNIVEMLDHFIVRNRHILILEFCPNGSLEDLLASRPKNIVSEKIAKKYVGGLVNGIEYLHNQNICHCNVTCKNVLLDAYDQPKLCDFSQARRHEVGNRLSTDYPHPSPYQPPETILHAQCYNPYKVDPFSVGIVMYRLLTNMYMFGDKTSGLRSGFRFMNRNIDSRTYNISEDGYQFMTHTMAYDPEERMTISEMKSLPWLSVHAEKKVSIGSHYLLRKPERGEFSQEEKQLKSMFHI